MVLLSSLLTNLFQEAEAKGGPWWVLGWLIAVVLVALLISWLMQRGGDTDESVPAEESATEPAETTVSESTEPETITKVEEAASDANDTPIMEQPAAALSDAASDKPAQLPETPAQDDDLTRIEGVGPKVASILKKKGIVTYNHLANTEVDTLAEILKEAKLPMLHPDSWPEQARLAAMDDWDGLSALQDELKGGRKVA